MAEDNNDYGFTFLPQGAIIQEFKVAGFNIVQSFPKPEQYHDAAFFGETIGRTTNRIKDGVIQNLNGKTLKLAQNNKGNHLHGGSQGWGKKRFAGPVPVAIDGKESVYFTYTSPDGDEGYPGTVEVGVFYTAFDSKEDGIPKTVLEVEYEVEFTGDECEETTIGVTNHSYFNISGSPSIEGTEVRLATNKYQAIDDKQIPTGTIEAYPGIEANKSFTLGAKEPAIDHCFVMDGDPKNVPTDTRELPLRRLVSLFHPTTKLHLDVSSTEPAFQFYTGEYVDVPATEHSPAKPPRAGICIEPSRYINAINIPEWRHMVLLKRGEKWGAKTVYQAWKS